jgi:predicted phage tail protein
MFPFHSLIRKACALTTVTLILPALAYADRDNDRNLKSDHHEQRGDRDRDKQVPVVPEANAGWVLMPFVGAVLLFSWRQFSRAKA